MSAWLIHLRAHHWWPGLALVAGLQLIGSTAAVAEEVGCDVVIAIDRSMSTQRLSLMDIDGDGKASRPVPILGRLVPTLGGREDSLGALHLALARHVIEGLHPERDRAGIVVFAYHAKTFIPLTDPARAARAVDQLKELRPEGMTNLHEGVLKGTLELLGTRSAASKKREHARRILVLITDLSPTLPDSRAHRQNLNLAIKAARRAEEAGIQVHTYFVQANAAYAVAESYKLGILGATMTGIWTQEAVDAALRTTPELLRACGAGE